MSLDSFLKKSIYKSLINGEEVTDSKEPSTDLISPVTDEIWKSIVPARQADCTQAIAEAQKAYAIWSQTPAPQRAKSLKQVADLLLFYQKMLAEVMTMEMGKPISESLQEISYAASFFSWFAGEAERVYGKIIPSEQNNKSLKVIYEPVGVCAIITPWNFPLAMPARKLAAALAAGCTVVAKPSPETPISMLLLAKICHLANIPPGAVNVLIGNEEEIGKELLNSFAVRKISFTGSTKVGKFLYAGASETMKKITMELGGHAPLIVFNDADIKKAIEQTVIAKFRNSGQACISTNKILVQEKIYSTYIQKLTEAVKALKVGNPLLEETEVSTALHPQSQIKVKNHLEDALKKGAEATYVTKNCYEPKILSKITPSMTIFKEETFGPIAPITVFKETKEAIALANASEFGLAAYLFTESMKTANQVVSKLEYGMIGVNDARLSSCRASFGGVKSSGIGREGGPSGIYEYLSEKFVSIAF